MKAILLLVVVGCFAIYVGGCGDEPSAAPTATPAAPTADATAKTPAPDAPQFEPEYAVAIGESKTEPKKYTVTWSAKVNTGGWTMKTESVLVEEQMGAMAARIWVTLEEPNPADVVTQAVETITGKHDAGETKIERVEFSVRRQVRGVKSDWAPLYSVVKTIKYPY